MPTHCKSPTRKGRKPSVGKKRTKSPARKGRKPSVGKKRTKSPTRKGRKPSVGKKRTKSPARKGRKCISVKKHKRCYSKQARRPSKKGRSPRRHRLRMDSEEEGRTYINPSLLEDTMVEEVKLPEPMEEVVMKPARKTCKLRKSPCQESDSCYWVPSNKKQRRRGGCRSNSRLPRDKPPNACGKRRSSECVDDCYWVPSNKKEGVRGGCRSERRRPIIPSWFNFSLESRR